MPRDICPACQYPRNTCLCPHVSPVRCETRFHILQHPSEVKAAKNTARLCQLCMGNTEIWIGEQPQDFTGLIMAIAANRSENVAVLYPAEQSVSVTDYEQSSNLNLAHQVIVLDGTWKKAYKLWQLNTWLRDYPALKLENTSSNYHIRKSSKPGGVSTLEAIAAVLTNLEPGVETQPLFDILEARQSHFSRRL